MGVPLLDTCKYRLMRVPPCTRGGISYVSPRKKIPKIPHTVNMAFISLLYPQQSRLDPFDLHFYTARRIFIKYHHVCGEHTFRPPSSFHLSTKSNLLSHEYLLTQLYPHIYWCGSYTPRKRNDLLLDHL